MTPERRTALLAVARARRDRLAIAVLSADRTWSPEPEAPPMLRLPVWSGLRWAAAA